MGTGLKCFIFAVWAIAFGLSYFVASLGWAEQGEAFLYIYLGAQILLIIAVIFIIMIGGAMVKEKMLTGGVSGIIILVTIFFVAVTLFTTWVVTQLFNVDYFVVYQIMTFGQCLSVSSKSNNDD